MPQDLFIGPDFELSLGESAIGGQIPKFAGLITQPFFPILMKLYIYEFRRPLATSEVGLDILKVIWHDGPKRDQIWAWLHRGHRWAVGVWDPLKSLGTGPSFI